MEKLNNHLKGFIKRSIYEMGIIELHYYIDKYGVKLLNRALKLIEHLRYKKRLILRTYYKNCTQTYINYYKYNHEQLLKMGYIFKGGFYCKYDFGTIA